MNTIISMNLVLMKDKLKEFETDGFNYKDRKISKAGKVWVKKDKTKMFDLVY